MKKQTYEVYANMKKNNKEIYKKAGAVALGLGIVGASVFAGSQLFPKTITEEVIVDKIVYEDKIVEKEVPVEVIVEKEVLIDNGNLDLVLEYIYDGDVELLTEDLEDDELDLIVDRVIFLNDAKALSENFVKSNFKEHLVEELELEEDEELISDVYIISTSLKDVDFESYEDFGFKFAKADVEVAYRYDDSNFKTIVLEVEIVNNKIRFI